MNKKVMIIITIALVLISLVYQNKSMSDARNAVVSSYTVSMYHLQRVNDIMLEKMISGQFDKKELQGFANRCIDLGIRSHDIGLPAQNYYNRLVSGFNELAESIETSNIEETEKLTHEMLFLLESLKEVYSLIYAEIEDDPYKKIFVTGEINQLASEYLATQEKSYYK